MVKVHLLTTCILSVRWPNDLLSVRVHPYKAHAKLFALSNNADKDTKTTTGSMVIPPVADTTTSMDMFQPAAHVSSRPSSAASTSRLASAVPYSSAAPQSRLASLPRPSRNPGSAGKESTGASVDLSPVPSLLSDSSVTPISRPTMIGAMKPKQGPFVPQRSRHITRSVSMKGQSVKSEHAEIEDTTINSYTVEGKGHICALSILYHLYSPRFVSARCNRIHCRRTPV